MPRIKQLLAEGKLVRMFGVGQLFSPKLIEIVGEHGGFDALWLDAEHAGLGDEGHRARHDGRPGLRAWTTSSACRRPITPRSCGRSRRGPGA